MNEELEEEISLIDLLAVVFRYRWLVIITTCIFGLLGFCIFWSASFTFEVKEYSDIAALNVKVNNKNLVEEKLKKLGLHGEYKDVLKTYSVSVNALSSKKAFEKASEKVEEICSYVKEKDDKALLEKENYINDFLKNQKVFVESLKAVPGVEQTEKYTNEYSSYYASLRDKAAIDDVKDKALVNLVENEDGETIHVDGLFSGSRLKKAIIMAFAGCFLSIFAAFCINAIKNIRNDPEVLAKFKA